MGAERRFGLHDLVGSLRQFFARFEYEFQMAAMNARLDSHIETVFLMASERQQFISSRFVKEIGRLGGDISSFVSAPVAARLRDRFDIEQKSGDGTSRRRQTFKDEA
jgi:pantetheine-phosphate adenylyltransferase